MVTSLTQGIMNRTDPNGDDTTPAPGRRTLNLRHHCRVATWNVQTLLRPGYPEILSRELASYNISIAGLCETRWRDSGEKTIDGYHYLWSGPNNNRGLYGVALALPATMKQSIVSWRPVSARLLMARLHHHHGKITVIVAYAPTDIADQQHKDTFFDQLQNLVQTAPPHDIVIVLTDANATVSADIRDPSLKPISGTAFIDPTTNDNGRRLAELCRAEDLCLADTYHPRKSIHHYTWYSNDGRTKKAIDHILISARWRACVTQCRVHRGAQLGNTDHRLLVANMRFRLKAERSQNNTKIDSSRLKETDIQARYQVAISNRFEALAQDASTDWDHFKEEVMSIANETLARRNNTPRRPWISAETLDIIDRRREARLRGDNATYRQLNAQRNASIRRDREAYWDGQAAQLEAAAQSNDLRLTYSLLKKAKTETSRSNTLIKDRNGAVLTTEDECLARWKEHFSELLNHPPVPENDALNADVNNNRPADNPDCNTEPVTSAEVRAALTKLKNAKAPGICGITAEMLKYGGNNMILWLTDIINHVWVYETLPDDWRRGIILPFWKGKGDQLVCKNHRGITLLSIPGKLFARILLTRAIPAIRSRRRPQQAGFMPGRSTTDHISALRLMVEKAREYRKDRRLYIAFIDLRAAFDTVDHGSLWKILHLLGTPEKISTLFRRMYDGATSSVRINGKVSEPFTINSGVRQGCVAAPDLFNCIIDYLMTKVSERVPGVSFGSYHLADLEYADDTALFTESLDDLTLALDVFNEEATKLGLVINWEKTELMVIGDGPEPQPLTYEGTQVKFVPSFKYLGSTITSSGDIRPEVNRRRALAASALKSLDRPLWKQRHVSRRTKMRVYNATILPILLYGSETWAMTKYTTDRINGFDSRALRRIERIFWPETITNVELRARTQQPPAANIIAERRVRWYGHLLRLPPDHPTKALLDFQPQRAGWRRPRGAPRTRWIDVVAEDLRRCNVTIGDAPQLAQQRSVWRSLGKRVGSTHHLQED